MIDDLRVFTDMPDAVYARNSAVALEILAEGAHWDEVWFDHDLGGDDTTRPVLQYLEMQAFEGAPVIIGRCVIHTSNPVGAHVLEQGLSRLYATIRVYAGGLNVTSI